MSITKTTTTASFNDWTSFYANSRVVDVFAMPQSGTGVSVEAVDYVYQTAMMDRLKQTGR